jgi:hypothetical protein
MEQFAEETGTETETTCVKTMLPKETVYQAMPPDDLIPMETLLMFTDKSILTLKTIILSSAGVCTILLKPLLPLILTAIKSYPLISGCGLETLLTTVACLETPPTTENTDHSKSLTNVSKTKSRPEKNIDTFQSQAVSTKSFQKHN